ncbi:MAG: gliding motility-associated ABC transporter substrate-binding protein GldG [Flavobacteriales bacterium]|nr:gliding motility-associated ABC transporter substrate-binding protein GldG [Flavobacteriales bacterium]
MFAIFKREINKFFSSAIGYLVLSVFLLVNGLFFWYFEGNYNILNNGYASLDSFFRITPWFFIFLIPALTMGMISEEKRQGTLELLLTHPIKESKIYFAKFFATLALVLLALIPTLIYVYSIYQLSLPVGKIDIGAITASYIGLVLISGAFTAIGMFSSTLSNNQITSFITAVIISVLFYYAFDLIARIDFLGNFIVRYFGMMKHFASISRGVIKLSDIVYFFSIIILFSSFAILQLKRISWNTKKRKSDIKQIFTYLAIIVGVNYLLSLFVFKVDFTSDKKYTIKEQSIDIIQNIDGNINIQVLLTGDNPSGFKQLESEVKRTLDDFRDYNSNITYSFIDPFQDKNNKQRQNITEELSAKGINPINIEINKKGEHKSKYVFPWALVKKNGKTIKVNLLKSKIGQSPERQLNNSIENIEYALIDAINKINTTIKPRIAILKGHNELNDAYITDFLKNQYEYYNFEKLNLSTSTTTLELENLMKNFQALIVIKPGKTFSEKEKLLIDQYIMQGGKSMWLLDGVFADMDSLLKDGKMLAFPRELNLSNMLFKYGFRVNADLVKDLQYAPIKLASGNLGNNVQYHTVPWPFFPLAIPSTNNPIVKNIEAVKFQFASTIDTILSLNVRKTVLLETSKYTKIFGVPNYIDFRDAQEPINEKDYNSGKKILGLLLEGNFSSAYHNRILPFTPSKYLKSSIENKMIVYSDGDVIANQFQNGQALPLGYDKWFNQQYGNDELIYNSINYLLDDEGLLNIKRKEVTLRLLDKNRIQKEKTFWQLLNIFAPLLLLLIFAILFGFRRMRKYKIN